MQTPARTDLGWVRERLRAYQPTMIRDRGERRAAVAFVLRARPDGCEALFILRAEHPRDPWSGHVSLPGGRVDMSDAGPLAAVKREVREEVAVELERSGRLVARLDEVLTSARGRVAPMIITPFVFELTEAVVPRPNEEVQEVFWAPMTTLLDPHSTGTCRYLFEGQEILLPCFRVAGKVIWGLTYHMLRRFFALLDWRVINPADAIDPAYRSAPEAT